MARAHEDSADDAVRDYLARHSRTLLATEAGLRNGDGEAVHDARTSTRRLRTALSVYCDGHEPLRSLLRDLGHALGAARDPAVELHTFERALLDGPPDLIRGPVLLRLDEDRSAAEQAGLDALGAWIGSSWADLERGLAKVVADPGAVQGLAHGARRAWRQLDRAVGAVDSADERDEALHEVRKAARRARYASEVAQEVVGRPARRSAKRARRVQGVLGDHQDAVVRRETLRRVSLQAFADGEDTFTYGRLHALADRAADEAELEATALIDLATSRRHRRWTR